MFLTFIKADSFCMTFLWPTHLMSPYLPSATTRYWLCLRVGKANTNASVIWSKNRESSRPADCHHTSSPVSARGWVGGGLGAWWDRPPYATRHNLFGTLISNWCTNTVRDEGTGLSKTRCSWDNNHTFICLYITQCNGWPSELLGSWDVETRVDKIKDLNEMPDKEQSDWE